MSVKQVKAISIIGMMSELENVVKFCGDSQMFHPDDAMSFYSDTQSFVPLHTKNPYTAPMQELENSAQRILMRVKVLYSNMSATSFQRRKVLQTENSAYSRI